MMFEEKKLRAVPILVGVLALALALAGAGCGGGGGGSSDTESSGGGNEVTEASSDPALQYSQCMRENGVPNFPDPEEGKIQITPGSGVDPESPEFQEASEACRQFAPSGAPTQANEDLEQQVLEYAQCMRENGVPDFPDPKVSGGAVQLKLPKGVSESSPQFREAQEACGELLAGLGGDGGAP